MTLIPAEIRPEVEEDILAFLKRNRLVPLFYEKAKRLPGLFSVDFTDKLKEMSRQEMMRMMRMEGVFIKVMRLFAGKQIPVVHIKGFSIASQLYEKTFLRPMNDLDMLVHPEDFERAGRELMKAGATTEESDAAESAPGISFDKTFVMDGVRVELHHHLMNPVFKNTPDRALIFQNTETAMIQGMECRILNREKQLYYLLHHLSRHWDYHLARFIWMMDIHYYLQYHQDRLDWEKFLALADKTGYSRDIYRGLYVCQELFGDKLPEGMPVSKDAVILARKYLAMCKQDRSRLFVGSFKMIMQIKGWRYKMRFLRDKVLGRMKSR